jgi:NAD(P)-dependent dehydrogenase (short-subunit alcohol dehydrogenase family)
LNEKVVVVTGGGGGLGRSHCLELARQGATLIVNDVGSTLGGDEHDAGLAETVAAEVRAAGGRAFADTTSVTDYDGIAALIERTVSELGRIDGIVNNAGVVRASNLVDMDEEDFDVVLGVHMKGTFNLIKHAAVHFHERWETGDRSGGAIVNTTSGAGLRGSPGLSYATAKAAIAAMTVSSSMQLRRFGVTVNAISPVARTRMNPATFASFDGLVDEGFDPVAPENVSPVVAYLLSDAASWLTGQVVRVDANFVRRYHPWTIASQSYQALDGRRLTVEELDDALRILYGVLPVPLYDPRNLREVPGFDV